MHLVLHVAARHVPALGAAHQDHAAALVRILGDGLLLDRGELFPRDQHAPPASAGMIATSSPSLSGVPSPSIASLFT